ncbi:MAG: ACP S-malonyltransferase [candidate division FCPU426 bacterium]
MSKTGLVFPGQGSQFAGMGKELVAAFPEAQAIYRQADEILGFPLTRLMLEGPEEELKQTSVAQPAILTASMAAWAALGRVWKPDSSLCLAAGHSLGEYSALVAAGVMDFAVALKLVRRRGELMQEAAQAVEGGMAAVIGLTEPEVTSLCLEADANGQVQPANFNSPGQVVVSGSKAGLASLESLAKARKVRVLPLAVSGPFHSRFMQPAADRLAPELAKVELRPARFPVIANVSAAPVTQPDEIRAVLLEQVTGSVRWEESVRKLTSLGATRLLEIGPGKVLRGLVKKIDPSLAVFGAFALEEINQTALEVSRVGASS